MVPTSSRPPGAVRWWRLLLLLLLAVAAAEEATYPEEVHRLVLARLKERGRGPVQGTWGTWASWSACSRTCGGGVSTQSRKCKLRETRSRAGRTTATDANKCVGRYMRFQLCNAQACPGPPQDFRKQQCEQFNRTPFNDRTYQWEPYFETLTSCVLNCRALGLNFYATLNDTVVDGTPCGALASRRVCVAGKCLEVGCDGLLASGKRVDVCGVCGGDGSTCRTVVGEFTQRHLTPGYTLVITLPTGAANISVMQAAVSPNSLAVKDPVSGGILLRGGRLSNGSLASLVEAGGTTFGYRADRTASGDSLTARGPLLHPVDIMLFTESPNVGVHYRYQLPPGGGERAPHYLLSDNPLNPLLTHPEPPSNGFSFPVNDAQASSAYHPQAPPGPDHYGYKPNEAATKKLKAKRKNLSTKGNHKSSPYKWKSAGFSPCSATCGGGVQVSHEVCVRRKRQAQVPEQNCYSQPRPPPRKIPCGEKPCPPRWEAEEWGECSVACGVGLQRRAFACKQGPSGAPAQSVLDDSLCPRQHSMPHAQVCHQSPCGTEPSWHVGKWGECSTRCGFGTRTRRVTCMSEGRNVLHHLCSPPRPSDQEMCDMGSCASNTWFFSAWEDQCSALCGLGHQTRRVHCNADPLDAAPECDLNQRPDASRSCDSVRDCGGLWLTGEWSTCTAECGGSGTQHRLVTCATWGRSRYRIAQDEAPCAGKPKPDALKICHKTCEPLWFTSEWSQCTVSCGGGVQRREVKCLDDHLQPSLLCPAAAKPDTRRTCATHRCAAEGTVLESAISNEVDSDEPATDRRGGRVLAEASQPLPARVPAPEGWCVDRMKNCNLVFKARLCRLKYYSKLCCRTCAPDLL